MPDLFVLVQCNERYMFYEMVYVLSNICDIFLYILERQALGFLNLISLLNSCKDFYFLMF